MAEGLPNHPLTPILEHTLPQQIQQHGAASRTRSASARSTRGCLEWQRRGLEPPRSVTAATEQYRAESDPVADFLRERCATGPELTARAGELYITYQFWALKQGLKEREQLTATRFGRLMGQRFPKDSDRDGTFYQGVALRPAEANDAL